MKKDKNTRSLTAKERKELRNPVDNEPIEQTISQEDIEKKKDKKFIITSCVVGVVAIILILMAILLPILFNKKYINDTKLVDENGSPMYSYETTNPVVTFVLSNGMKIQAELWEKECPIATSNFIYLAEIGYFNGTIIYDNTDGWIRFGGYTADGKHRGDEDKKFLDSITDRDTYKENKFGYRLKKDSSSLASKAQEQGVLSFNYRHSATEFQFMANEQGNNNPVGDKTWDTTSFGRIIGDDLDNLIKIANITTVDKNFANKDFTPPMEKTYITIKKVQVKNLSKKKWKEFDFVKFVDGNNYKSNWDKYNQKKLGQI